MNRRVSTSIIELLSHPESNRVVKPIGRRNQRARELSTVLVGFAGCRGR